MPKRQFKAGIIAGFLAGCPVCAAKQGGSPCKGDRFQIIAGYNAGQKGSVVIPSDPYQLKPYAFVAQMDDDPSHCTRRILYETELVRPLHSSRKPSWAPALTLADFATIHESLLSFCESSTRAKRWHTDFDLFALLIARIWEKRLPITANELRRVLFAHGVPRHAWQKLHLVYQTGLNCLVYACGRRPIKRKRTKKDA